MTIRLLCLLLLMARVGLAQKINYTAAVNPPSNQVSTNLSSINVSYAPIALTPVAKAKVQVDYTVFVFLFGFGMVKTNVKNDFDDLRENITAYAANTLFTGGTAGSRYSAAQQVVAQLMRLNDRIIVNGQDVSFFKNYPFAQDLLLFRTIYYDNSSTIFVQDTPDAGIPFRFISNYPLSIVNGQRQPIVVDNTKSIRIK